MKAHRHSAGAMTSFFVTCLTWLGSSAGASQGADLGADHAPVVELLVALGEDPERVAPSFANDLDALRPTRELVFLEIYGTQGVPAGWLGGAEHVRTLGRDELDEIWASLLRAGPARLREILAQLADLEPRVRFREIGVDLLGEFGGASDLRLLTRLAAPLQTGSEVLPRSLRTSFEKALYRVVEREPRSLSGLVDRFDEIHIGLQSSVVDALSRIGSEPALVAMASLLGRSPSMDSHVLVSIARLAGGLVLPIDAGATQRVRNYLGGSDERLTQMAVRAVGSLEDFESIPALLELYDAGGRDLREAVHRAMRSMTGVNLHLAQGAWPRWYEREMEWWSELRPDALRELRHGDVPAACKAISALARRCVHRHRLAESLLLAFERPERELHLLACEGLALLGSKVPVPRLVELLSHRDAEVANAAWEALKAITGESHPPVAELWLAAS